MPVFFFFVNWVYKVGISLTVVKDGTCISNEIYTPCKTETMNTLVQDTTEVIRRRVSNARLSVLEYM